MNFKSYTVISGDTLSGICKKIFGRIDEQILKQVMADNRVTNPNRINVGQILKFSTKPPTSPLLVKLPPDVTDVPNTTDIVNNIKKTTKLLTPNQFSRPRSKIKEIKGVVVHWVANTKTSAEANRMFFENRKNGKNNCGSAHYIIDLNGDIIQCIPDNEVAYHVGAKIDKYKPEVKEKLLNNPNFYTLGIECTHIKDSGEMSQETYNSLIQLTMNLCKQYKVEPLTFLFRHFDITGKLCHKWFVDNPEEWKKFKNRINELLKT